MINNLKIKIELTKDELKFIHDFFSSMPGNWEEINSNLPTIMEKIKDILYALERREEREIL